MFIEMLKDDTGCDDGIHSRTYLKGEIHNVSESLAQCFISRGTGKKVKKMPAPGPDRTQHLPGAPNTKGTEGDKDPGNPENPVDPDGEKGTKAGKGSTKAANKK